jgi:hypothetical protein
MDFINSWKSKTKQWDKVAIKIRFGRLTLIDIYIDLTKKQFGISLFNIGVKTDRPYSTRNKSNGTQDKPKH